jgi:DNA-binding transcriptional MocR family regulator
MSSAQTPQSHLYLEVAEKVLRLAVRSRLMPGDRIPSIREISAEMKVSVSTVVRAFAHLEQTGAIEARPQSGYYLKPAHQESQSQIRCTQPSPAPILLKPNASDAEVYASVVQAIGRPGFVPLGAAVLHQDYLPIKGLSRAVMKVIRQQHPKAMGYDSLPGYPALRTAIAARGGQLGTAIDPDGIVTTVGAMEAIHLALLVLTRPGDVVAIESPTYHGIVHLLRDLGLRAIELPTDPKTGADIGTLEGLMKKKRIACCILTPNFNNPMGSLMPDENKEKIAALAGRHEIPVIEDDIYGDLQHGIRRPTVLKSFDRKNWVLLCSSFSKAIAPGYRVGWMVPGPRFQSQVEQSKFTLSIATPTLPQMAIAEYLHSGAYDRWLRKVRVQLMSRVNWMAQAVRASFPADTRLSVPQGGFVLWIELPPKIRATELHRQALSNRISIVPGTLFSPSRRYAHFIRLSAALPHSHELERAIATLGRLAHELL